MDNFKKKTACHIDKYLPLVNLFVDFRLQFIYIAHFPHCYYILCPNLNMKTRLRRVGKYSLADTVQHSTTFECSQVIEFRIPQIFYVLIMPFIFVFGTKISHCSVSNSSVSSYPSVFNNYVLLQSLRNFTRTVDARLDVVTISCFRERGSSV